MVTSTQLLNVLGKIGFSALALLFPPLKRWWQRYSFPVASAHRLSILIARVAGDNSANSNQSNIRDAIRETLPEVSIYIWDEEWVISAGEDQASQVTAYKRARKFLARKKCDLLVAGRVKSESVISIRFIAAAGGPSSPQELAARPLTYALATDTMDLPKKFTNDLASALGTCVMLHLNGRRASREILNALGRLTLRLQTLVEESPAISDNRVRAGLVNSYSLARAFRYEFSGNFDDLRSAIAGFSEACAAFSAENNREEWSRCRANQGAAEVRLGSAANDVEMLTSAIDVLKEALPGLTSDEVRWCKIQLSLALAYFELARVRGTVEDAQSAIDVCMQVLNTELLRQKESILWGAAADQRGRALALLAEARVSPESLYGSVEAFTDALEIFDEKLPELRAAVLANLSNTFISMGTRQNSLDWIHDAAARLRDARRLVS
ncbi:hypothetical protein ACQR10_05440 [Bradyrhizobium sp. HKCCYLRH2060]